MAKVDVHISAERIGSRLIQQVLKLGFEIDHFHNCVNSRPPTFHATYRGFEVLPNDDLWRELITILTTDHEFSGIAEEETLVSAREFGEAAKQHHTHNFPRLAVRVCAPDIHKACDIHIRANLAATSPDAIQALESLGIASFERERGGVAMRVFTATLPTIVAGQVFFDAITKLLEAHGGFVGRVKLEQMLRYYRYPASALTLPITTHNALDEWIGKIAENAVGGAHAERTSKGISRIV